MRIESRALERARREGMTRVAGGIIAEFADLSDAAAFAEAKGPGFTVTPGINHCYAVRTVHYVPMPQEETEDHDDDR